MIIKIQNNSGRKLCFDRYHNISNKYNLDLILTLEESKPSKKLIQERGKAEYVEYDGDEIEIDKIKFTKPLEISRITLYIGGWETEESIYWVYLHEFAHLLMARQKLLKLLLVEYSNHLEKVLKKLGGKEVFLNCYEYIPTEIYASVFAIENSGGFYGREFVQMKQKEFKKKKKKRD